MYVIQDGTKVGEENKKKTETDTKKVSLLISESLNSNTGNKYY